MDKKYMVIEISERDLLDILYADTLKEAIGITNRLLEAWCKTLDVSLNEDDDGSEFMRASIENQAAWCNLGNYNWDAYIAKCHN